MNGDLCIPVNLCHNQLQSTIIFSNASTHEHLSWDMLEATHNANQTYDDINNTDHFCICFHNLTGSFLFLEYCHEQKMGCTNNSCFCHNWLQFINRTCVNVNGSKYMLVISKMKLIYWSERTGWNGNFQFAVQHHFHKGSMLRDVIGTWYSRDRGSNLIHTILLPSQHHCRLRMVLKLVELRVQFQRQVKAVVLEC